MSPLLIITLILALTFTLLIFSKIPPAAIFIGALTLSITFKLAPLEDSLKGFNNPGVLTIGALFMIAAGMYSTGAISISWLHPDGCHGDQCGFCCFYVPHFNDHCLGTGSQLYAICDCCYGGSIV